LKIRAGCRRSGLGRDRRGRSDGTDAHDIGNQVGAVRCPDYEIVDFDCIAILGLLYHLELDDQIDVLRSASSRYVIVDTPLRAAT
jgi:hypothetical protein